jgi:hypothetical protein
MTPEHEILMDAVANQQPHAIQKLWDVLEDYEHLRRHHILVENEVVALRAELAERKKC